MLVDERRNSEIHEVGVDASILDGGVYVCRLQAGNFAQLRKLILLRRTAHNQKGREKGSGVVPNLLFIPQLRVYPGKRRRILIAQNPSPCPEQGAHLIEHSLHPLILVVGQLLSLVARHEKLLSM